MADWGTFAGFAGVVLGLLLLLAHASRHVVDGRAVRPNTGREPPATGEDPACESPTSSPDVRPGESRCPSHAHAVRGDVDHVADEPAPAALTSTGTDGVGARSDEASTRFGDAADGGDVALGGDGVGGSAERRPTGAALGGREDYSTGALLANVVISQGLFAALLVAGAWYAEVPASAFGISVGAVDPSALALRVGLGAGLGIALYAANEVGATVGERVGLGGAKDLRAALAPTSAGGWAVLLLVILPLIAGFEELLFRGALVGAFVVGFDVSPWLMAVVSSVAFALGHGAQGPIGVVVTGLLGFVLAVAFVLTGSLLVVVVAHYLVNALEFVVHEGLGVEWGPSG